MGSIEYSKNICAFIDILGYKNIVEEAEKDKENPIKTIKKLENIIQECIKEQIERFGEMDENIKFDYTIFSDCICIVTPIKYELSEDPRFTYSKDYSDDYINANQKRLYLIVLLLADIQMLALEHNIIFRGAITVGNHYSSENVMFSNALVKAYTAESKYAIYPRIILDNTHDNDFLNLYQVINAMVHNGLTVRDKDIVFIDYVGRINNMRMIGPGFTERHLSYHKKFIEDNLTIYRDDKKVLKKYIWLAKYHNFKLLPQFKATHSIDLENSDEVDTEFNVKINIPEWLKVLGFVIDALYNKNITFIDKVSILYYSALNFIVFLLRDSKIMQHINTLLVFKIQVL